MDIVVYTFNCSTWGWSQSGLLRMYQDNNTEKPYLKQNEAGSSMLSAHNYSTCPQSMFEGWSARSVVQGV